MGFTGLGLKKEKVNKARKFQSDLATEYGCAVCPLDKEESLLYHPKMEPTGSINPLIYILGEAPNAEEDEEGVQFIGNAGDLLRDTISSLMDDTWIQENIRWNSSVRCRPVKFPNSNRPPEQLELACCKKSIIEDVEKTKPLIIIGVGGVPLSSFVSGKMVSMWRGRIFPFKIGNHECYYAPISSPTFILKTKSNRSWETEDERVFKNDILRVFNFLLEYKKPTIISSGYKDDIDYVLGDRLLDIEKIKTYLDYFKKVSNTSIDIETVSKEKLKEKMVRPFGNSTKIVTVAISDGKITFAFPINHPEAWNFDINRESVLQSLLDLLHDFIINSTPKIVHNLKFELEWFAWFLGEDILWETKWEDTQAQAYIIDERTKKEEGMHGLDRCIFLHFGFNLKVLSSIINKKDVTKNKLIDVLIYNAMDAKYTYLLYFVQLFLIDSIQINAYNQVIGMSKSTIMAQIRGVLIDFDELNSFDKKFSEQLSILEKDIQKDKHVKKYVEKYGEFNPNSDDHLRVLFFEILKLRSIKETSGGKSGKKKAAVDKEVLEVFSNRYKIAEIILDYKEIFTLKSTFIDGARNCIFDDGRFHTNYNSMWTSTGRFSSDFPNLQNFPKRRNKIVRNMVRAG